MVQKLYSGYSNNLLSTSQERYIPLAGVAAGETSSANSLFPQAGVIRRVFVRLSTAPGGGGSYTIYVSRYRPSVGHSSWSITISNSLTGDSGTNEFAVSAGDAIHYRVVPSTSPAPTATPQINLTCEWVPTTDGDFTIPGYNRGGEIATATFFGISGEVYANTDEARAKTVMPACTLTRFSLCRDVVGAGNTATYTVRKNGVDTAATLTFVDTDASYALRSWTGSISIAEGDVLSIGYTYTGSPTASYSPFGLTCTPAVLGQYPLVMASYTSTGAGFTRYAALSGASASTGAFQATESNAYTYPSPRLLTKMLAWTSVAQGADKTLTIKLRKDGADKTDNFAAITFSNESGFKSSSGMESLVSGSYYTSSIALTTGGTTGYVSICYLADGYDGVTYYVDADAAGGGSGTYLAPYDSISAAEAARNTADGQGGGVGSYTDIVRYLCSASSGGKDTVGAYFYGGNQTASYYLLVQADTGHRATAKWDSSKFGIELTDANETRAVDINDDYIRLDGIQARIISTVANYCGIFGVQYNLSAANCTVISNCLGVTPATENAYTMFALSVGDVDAVVYVLNTVLWTYSTETANRACLNAGGNTVYVYNCTLMGGQFALKVDGANVYAKNTFAGGCAFDNYYISSGTLDKVNCASQDASADDTGTGETASNCIINVPLTTATFVDPTNATVIDRDWHLAGVDSDLYGAGVAPGGSDPLNYQTDIDGHLIGIGGRYDIGADFIYTSGQYGRPASVVAQGSWTPSAGTIPECLDETSPSDADYAASGAPPNELKLRLSPLNMPDSGTAALSVRLKRV